MSKAYDKIIAEAPAEARIKVLKNITKQQAEYIEELEDRVNNFELNNKYIGKMLEKIKTSIK